MREVFYRFSVQWKKYDEIGSIIEDDAKLFQTKEEANEFAMKIKRATNRNHTIRVIIKELEGNQIVRRLKKEKGKINYKRK